MEGEKIRIGIIGLGLMGGSAGLRLKEQSIASTVFGYDIIPKNCAEALTLGLVDEIVDLEQLSQNADLIIMAIPVNKALKLLPLIMANVHPDAVVIDFGSTKKRISKQADMLVNRRQFVACHPIAGTENTGPGAAFAQLYQDKVNIICDQASSSTDAIDLTIKISHALGMRIKFMDSASHDRHIAYVSHLSHISSFVLGETVLDVEKDEENIFDMASSGFASTVRLAKSSPDMWAPIFTENSDNILLVLDQYINNLNKFRVLIEESKEQELADSMRATNIIRKVLEGERLTKQSAYQPTTIN